jgi:hypothetical protein
VKAGGSSCCFAQSAISLSKSKLSIAERATGAVMGSIITVNGLITVSELSTTVPLGD